MTDDELDLVADVEEQDQRREYWQIILLIVLVLAGGSLQYWYAHPAQLPQQAFSPKIPDCWPDTPCTIYGQRSWTTAVTGDLVITTTSPLPVGVQGRPYTFQLQAVGGKAMLKGSK